MGTHRKSAPSFDKYELFNRRNFLKFSGGCAALSSTSILSTILDLRLTKAAMAAGGDLTGYKAIVCVFLSGGIDSFNMLAPYETQEHADYVTVRTNLAIPQAQLLMVTDKNNRKFGIHPAMPEVKALYENQKLAWVANLGSLVVPTTKANLNSVAKPLGLYSHSDLVRHWQTSKPQSRNSVTGWAGRMADMVTDTVNKNDAISMNISIAGRNIFETGSTVFPYTVGTGGATRLTGHLRTISAGSDPVQRMFTRFTDNGLSQTYGDLVEKSYAQTRKGALDAAYAFNDATTSAEVNNALANITFPNTGIGNQLKMVARVIASRGDITTLPANKLNQSRQIFFVTVGGWDHHADLLTGQQNQLPAVSQALNAFYNATVALGVASNVTTFTTSDFARTLNSNGVGSDHGWGGNHMVMGGAVRGGHVYGSYPTTLAPNNILDTGRGRLIPTTSVDQYNAELAMWFGMPNDSSLVNILPNVRNFYSQAATNYPIGFLQPVVPV